MILSKNKKGGVELSLNLIIMLIIGMIVMALIIAFVTKLIGQGSQGMEDQLSQAQQAVKTKIKEDPHSFAMGPDTLSMSSGSKSGDVVFLKVANNFDTNIIFPASATSTYATGTTMTITSTSSPTTKFEITNQAISGSCTVTMATPPLTVGGGTDSVLPIAIKLDPACKIGDQLFISANVEYGTAFTSGGSITVNVVE